MIEVETVLPDGNALGIPGGSTISYFRCPVAKLPFDVHPPVPCPNCGEDVPAQQFHWHSREGLLGSGRWTCISAADAGKTRAFFDDLSLRKDEPVE